MSNKKITIIGGGNMGSAIAEGLLKSGFSKGKELVISKRNVDSLKRLKDLGVTVLDDNKRAVADAEVIILAVKPYLIEEVLKEIAGRLTDTQLVISIAAGIAMDKLERIAGTTLPVFRVMPNTAIGIRQSMTCYCANKNATTEQKKWLQSMLEQLGVAVEIEEKQMDAATVIGACATAFALRFIRASVEGGVEIGFRPKLASLIVAQAVKGATELVIGNGSHPEEEIDKVTTPGGSTIKGLNAMEEGGFTASVIRGITASFEKIVKG